MGAGGRGGGGGRVAKGVTVLMTVCMTTHVLVKPEWRGLGSRGGEEIEGMGVLLWTEPDVGHWKGMGVR